VKIAFPPVFKVPIIAALISLFFGVLSFLLPGIASIPAIVMGRRAYENSKLSGDYISSFLALCGFWLGVLTMGLLIFLTLMLLVYVVKALI
jgi:hypothetical protein